MKTNVGTTCIELHFII